MSNAATARVGVPFDIVVVPDAGRDPAAVDVRFRGGAGDLVVPAFQAGDGSLKVRFAAPSAGTWAWSSVSTDARLDGRSGSLDAVAYDGGNRLYRHGRLGVAQDGRHLAHADGTPFLWIGDTWWYGLTSRLRWPDEFGTLLDDRVAKGFSLIQVVAGPLPEFPPTPEGIWDPNQANEAGWPWERDWAGIDGAFYDRADERIAAMVDAGIVPLIVSMWGYYHTVMGEDRVRRHWRNLVARYAAYPVIFCVAGEVDLPPLMSNLAFDETDLPGIDEARATQLAGWSRMAHEVRAMDPWHNPLTAHPAHPDVRRVLPDATALDIDMIQSSHWSWHIPSPRIRDFVDKILGLKQPVRFGFEGALALAEESVAMEPPMVVVNGEPCYEGILGSNWQEVQRFLFWSGMLAGLAGWTYGAQGIWQMNSTRQPELIRRSWGHGTWQEAMHYAGGRQIAASGPLLERLEWWRLRPVVAPDVFAAGRRSALGAASDRVLVHYLPSEVMAAEWGGVRALSIDVSTLAGAEARFVDPRTMEEHPIERVEPDADGRWTVPEPPSMEDWLLVVERAAGG